MFGTNYLRESVFSAMKYIKKQTKDKTEPIPLRSLLKNLNQWLPYERQWSSWQHSATRDSLDYNEFSFFLFKTNLSHILRKFI
jgi:hypothetical protein